MKKLKKVSFFLLLAIGSFSSSSFLLANQINQVSTEYDQSLKIHRQTDKSDLIHFNNSTRLPTIISDLGPVLMNGNTIFQLDWFGKKVWSTNVFEQLKNSGHIAPDGTNEEIFGFPVGTAVIGWKFSKITHKIYLHIPATRIGNDNNANDDWKYQYIIPLDPENGKLEIVEPKYTPRINVSGSTWNGTYKGLRFQFGIISELDNGSILVYGLLGTTGLANGGFRYHVFNPAVNKIIFSGNILGMQPRDYGFQVNNLLLHTVQPITTIPIGNNKTLFLTRQGLHPDTEWNHELWNEGQYNSNIFTFLVNNNFLLENNLWKESPLWWQPSSSSSFIHPHRNSVLVTNNNYGLNNSYYQNLVADEIWIPFLNKIFFVKPNNSTLGYKATSLELPKLVTNISPWYSGILYSSYLDLRGNLFFNMAIWNDTVNDWKIDTTVFKLDVTTKKN
ncbi:hypothetical protein J2Z62_000019 [Mycoplasmoides fastidiosum]|uniref:DUF31 domain-containing protein n=1 Tax=Mycoplasmoides fastidiosum TaxID=92758 RepID=A0ABU0LXZ8_9BACT|nr:hypothetical protein [Mycoplasmoides fastidiosum]MDQ0513581.1 hypothetical protein [Mycoplasmoides fastidiosum]UUD37996.1 hypothetical protein NPA10_01200 [Mycoplasmoides fastidiosum]